MSSSPTISAFIVCCNEEQRIRQCLESVKWCNEIVVIDSGSTDRTLEIVAEYKARVFKRAWPGFVEQKRFALAQCQGDWVLNIDADEEVSPELATEIKECISTTQTNVGGFELLRVVFFLGRWWRKGGWYPEYRLRLCRRSMTTWGGEDPHEHAEVAGQVIRLHSELHHYTYLDFAGQVRSLNTLSTAAANNLAQKGKTARFHQIIGNPLSRFIKFYFVKKGYREGVRGFLVALIEAFYVFLKYAKLWEVSRFSAQSSKPNTHKVD